MPNCFVFIVQTFDDDDDGDNDNEYNIDELCVGFGCPVFPTVDSQADEIPQC